MKKIISLTSKELQDMYNDTNFENEIFVGYEYKEEKNNTQQLIINEHTLISSIETFLENAKSAGISAFRPLKNQNNYIYGLIGVDIFKETDEERAVRIADIILYREESKKKQTLLEHENDLAEYNRLKKKLKI